MAISDKTRKVLWSRAHDRCALCKAALTRDRADGEVDVVGVEAHIVAQSVRGPRGETPRPHDVDGYNNLLLVCPNDHQRIDQNPEHYTPALLRDLKRAHERWATTHYDVTADGTPSPPSRLVQINEANHGQAIWDAVAGAAAYFLENEVPEEDDERRRVAAQFLQAAFDYGEISDDIQALGPRAVHDAVDALARELRLLQADGLTAWTGRTTADIGGVSEPLRVPAAVVVVRLRPVATDVECACTEH